MHNSFGHLFRLTTFGESHGVAVGGVIDGMPAGVVIDINFVQSELNRRRPGQSNVTTSRAESDQIEFLSGLFEGETTGAPIAFVVFNQDQRSQDYDALRTLYRPSHADFTYKAKYGIRDYRGGGRASARITLARCVAGAIAKLALRQRNIHIHAYTSQIGSIALPEDYHHYDFNQVEQNVLRCPDSAVALQMETLIMKVKQEGDTIGGIVSCVIQGCPPGLGEPEFSKLHADLGSAMLSINAAKGFEYGDGFASVTHRGSEINDSFTMSNGCVTTSTNHSGGIQGGISNGQDIFFRVAFKPVATLQKQQKTINEVGEIVSFAAKGRHDPCVVPRAVPIVEAMAAMVIFDHYLLSLAEKF